MQKSAYITSTLYVFPAISKNFRFVRGVANLGVHNFPIHQNDTKLHSCFQVIFIR